jgi:CO/xanthine dehydrogenase FAD-binding subunit
MDLHSISHISRPSKADELGPFGPGDAWLAGGTWLFSEPQPQLTRLIDLQGLGWPPLTVGADGLTLAATCTIADLDALQAPADWLAAPLIGQCCRSFLASFKIWNMATVGGNLCMALPAGPMISLCVALDGRCTILTPDGGERSMSALDFVRGPQQPALERGEILRSIHLPLAALRSRTAFRRISLSPLGRSGALLIGTLAADGRFALTVTAATCRPLQATFAACPDPATLSEWLADEIPAASYYDDVHGRPDWRRHMTAEFAAEIRAELAEAGR